MNPLLLLVLLPPVLWSAVAIHEIGHLMASWSVGIRADRIRIGTGRMVRFRAGHLLVELGLFPWAGEVDIGRERMRALFRQDGSAGLLRLAWVFFGGPLFSLVCGAASVGYVVLALGPLAPVDLVLAGALTSCAVHWIIAALTTLPVRSDGGQIAGLLREARRRGWSGPAPRLRVTGAAFFLDASPHGTEREPPC